MNAESEQSKLNLLSTRVFLWEAILGTLKMFNTAKLMQIQIFPWVLIFFRSSAISQNTRAIYLATFRSRCEFSGFLFSFLHPYYWIDEKKRMNDDVRLCMCCVLIFRKQQRRMKMWTIFFHSWTNNCHIYCDF